MSRPVETANALRSAYVKVRDEGEPHRETEMSTGTDIDTSAVTTPSAIGVIEGDVDIDAVCDGEAPRDHVDDNDGGAIEIDGDDEDVRDRRLLRLLDAERDSDGVYAIDGECMLEALPENDTALDSNELPLEDIETECEPDTDGNVDSVTHSLTDADAEGE